MTVASWSYSPYVDRREAGAVRRISDAAMEMSAAVWAPIWSSSKNDTCAISKFETAAWVISASVVKLHRRNHIWVIWVTQRGLSAFGRSCDTGLYAAGLGLEELGAVEAPLAAEGAVGGDGAGLGPPSDGVVADFEDVGGLKRRQFVLDHRCGVCGSGRLLSTIASARELPAPRARCVA